MTRSFRRAPATTVLSRGRRIAGGFAMVVVLGWSAGCGSSREPDGTVADPAASQTATQTLTWEPVQTPSEAPREEPRTKPSKESSEKPFEPDLSALSDADRSLIERYSGRHENHEFDDGSVVFAAPMTVDEAAIRLFGTDPKLVVEGRNLGALKSAYSISQVGDGIIAHEDTGYAEPPRRILAALSAKGVVSAVATTNLDAMVHFGYAQDGRVVFDSFEYAFVDQVRDYPEEVRDLATLAWENLDGPPTDTVDWFEVALAMSEKVTGVRADPGVQEGPPPPIYVVDLPWT